MRKVLLDTSAYSRLMAGDRSVFDVLSDADTVFMSVIVLGELFAGFSGGSRERENKEVLGRFLTKPTVKMLPATMETAEVFGFVKNKLRIAGTPIPINDVWIAAHAVETGSMLVTFDEHFRHVPGLRSWNG